MDFNGKSVLITGGTKGIGAAIAVDFAKLGADVAIAARHPHSETADLLKQNLRPGRRCQFIPADCSLQTDIHRMVEDTVSHFGRLDVVVHAAGGPVNGRLFEISENDWYQAFQVHVHAVFHLCRSAIPHLKKQPEGAIVLVSSTAGIRGVATNIAYQAAKGALPQMTRALAREFADDNIRINCVAPGVIRTDFHKSMTEAQRKLNLEQRIPLHREGTPAQVASLVVEMVRNDYITGETFTIDGGLTMRIA